MKTNPYQWFADSTPPRTVIESGYQPLSIDTLLANTGDSSATLGAAVFGPSASFDFSRIVQAIVPAHATLSASRMVDVHVGGPHVLAHIIDAPLEMEAPTQPLSCENIPDNGAFAATLAQPPEPAADESAGPVVGLHDDAHGHIPDLGFLQNLPAGGVVGPANDLFISETAPLPDHDGIQFAAVLPDPIVDPGPLV